MDEYIVSARKYRPMTFDSVVGQRALTTTLKNAVKSGKLAHAYLFCGPRGVGKTTCARIFAKAINCMSPTAEGEACNECESCKAFNEQRSFNIYELDAASNNSVDNIRNLCDQVRVPPQIGKYKVYIIDEVHMLSTQAFNAFLKTLEEPPSHVIFILATTEKQKILPTILSRCQIYDFERMSVGNTVKHLKYVAEKEGVTYESEALNVIAEKADGGMRDALSIFDQAVSFCQGNITYNKVVEDLNVLDIDNYFKVVDFSIENKVQDIIILLNNIINKGFDAGNFVNGLASHIRSVLMAKDASTLPLLEVSEQQRGKYSEQAKKCSVKFIYKALKILNDCDINYRQSHNKRLLVELSLIQVAQITQPDDDDVGAGLRPYKRLKTIFKQLVVAARPAKAVASTDREAISQKMPHRAGSSVKEPSVVVPLKKIASSPVKLSSIGVSFTSGGVNQKPKIVEVPKTEIREVEINKPFTQDQLSLGWMEFCNRLPVEEKAMAGRMRNMNPLITEYPSFEIVLDNDLVLSDMQQLMPRVLKYLHSSLQNSKIQMVLRIAAKGEVFKPYTRAEQLKSISEKNPAISKLRDILGLELA